MGVRAISNPGIFFYVGMFSRYTARMTYAVCYDYDLLYGFMAGCDVCAAHTRRSNDERPSTCPMPTPGRAAGDHSPLPPRHARFCSLAPATPCTCVPAGARGRPEPQALTLNKLKAER
jgi:hypothetical protein